MSSYRYGFNGKELNPEFQGATYDYGFRIYDARIAKFLSVDPLFKGFPMLTPYQFASNSPIANIDLDGLEAENFMFGIKEKLFGATSLKMNNLNSVLGEVQRQTYFINIGNPTMSVQMLYDKIANDINSIYGTEKGAFSYEKQQNAGKMTVGDIIRIDPGVKGLDIFVEVTNVEQFNEQNPSEYVDDAHKGFSITFRTLEGHVETGLITFTAYEITSPSGVKSFKFYIESTSQIDVGLATTVLNNYARNSQQAVWAQVLQNIVDNMGGELQSSNLIIEKYEPLEYNVVEDNPTTLGSPKPEATPEIVTKTLPVKKR